jgi:hypothetical protein
MTVSVNKEPTPRDLVLAVIAGDKDYPLVETYSAITHQIADAHLQGSGDASECVD